MPDRVVSLGAQVMWLWLVLGVVAVGGGVALIVTAQHADSNARQGLAGLQKQIDDTRKATDTADTALARSVAATGKALATQQRTTGLVKCLTRPTRNAVSRCLGVQPGAPGQPGSPGVAGAPGRPGKAAQGLVGPQGATGQQGPPGEAIAGPPGPKGTDGTDGADGTDGKDGEPGGPAGDDGAPGVEGPQGVPGPAGADGPTGPAGPIGADAVFPATLTCTPDPPPALTLTCVAS